MQIIWRASPTLIPSIIIIKLTSFPLIPLSSFPGIQRQYHAMAINFIFSFQQVSASDDHVVDRARSWCEMVDVRYFRYNPTLPTPVELNQTDDRILLNMLLDVRKYINRNFQSILSLSKVLLGES